MQHLSGLYKGAGRARPSAVKTAVVIGTGQAITVQEFDRLPSPPTDAMTAADWAFDRWVDKITRTGSAYRELNG
jgi:hypothetical protein